MDYQTWQQLAEIKAQILDMSDAILDHNYPRQNCTSKLIQLAKKLHELENVMLYQECKEAASVGAVAASVMD